MATDDLIELNGEITETFRGGVFKVRTETDKSVFCKPAGKLRLNEIKLIVGDKVVIQVSPYDLNNGRIVKRLK